MPWVGDMSSVFEQTVVLRPPYRAHEATVIERHTAAHHPETEQMGDVDHSASMG